MQILQMRRITSISDQDKNNYASQLEVIGRLKS